MQEFIEGKMDGKKERVKPHIMLLVDIKANETYEKINRIAIEKECWRTWMSKTDLRTEHR